ncbi:uncharacterized protein cubi_00860 [Cryptosporidium ubiquitum]|uniref:Uncharacterized protein n=1 Tax=Cryptosporidium ubiquitum TaxID=857276 RepID=A0A1J4MF78_9CRYT|nr:uncharacterized protein cubi_00860 [Cryptosporidium ubiquitum]OII72888.1 hypothetical protein cubi_00860 [Cryptosporidium ubiquitum]
MKGVLYLILIQLWFLIGKVFISANKVLNSYEYWEEQVNSVSINSQADNINTHVKKNADSYIRENLDHLRSELPENHKTAFNNIKTKPKHNFKTINFKENELSETDVESNKATNNCECIITNNSCWTKSACIGVASTISVSSLFIFIAIMWLVQAFSTYAAKEEHIIFKNKLKNNENTK